MRAIVVMLAAVLFLSPSAAFGQEADNLLGKWSANNLSGGIEEQITVSRDAKGVWHVDSLFYLKGTEVGSGVGENVRLVDKTIVFNRKVVKQPSPPLRIGPEEFGLRLRRYQERCARHHHQILHRKNSPL